MSGDKELRTSVAADLGSLADLIGGDPERAAAVELPAGTVVGDHFEIEAAIGRGGMGAVYRARDRRLDRRVALKLGLAGADLARARREAVALARLAHPNVVTLHEVGEHAGIPFVAMELCEGGTARSWANAATRSWRAILAVYLDAGRGLAAAHAAGLVHRDVKPDNILRGTDGRARIGDFGLARDGAGLHGASAAPSRALLESADTAQLDGPAAAGPPLTPGGSDDAITRVGTVVGTPRYMAPEQLDGRAIDARVDQFAFARALLESMAVAAPPRRVVAVVQRACAADPAARYPSMQALLAALTRAARPRWWIGGALVGVGVAAAAIALGAGAPVTRPPAAAPPPPPCQSLPADLASAWNPTARAAFVDGNLAAGATARWVADVISYDADAWRVTRARVCGELPRDPAWSAPVAARSEGCLARAAFSLGQFAAFRDRDTATLTAAVAALQSPAGCADPIKIAKMVPADDPNAFVINRVQRRVGEIDVQFDRGDRVGALAAAHEVLRLATLDGVPLAIALAELSVGNVLRRQGSASAAYDHLRTAYFGLRSGAAPMLTFETAIAIAEVLVTTDRLDLADEWLAQARADAARLRVEPLNLVGLELVAARIAAQRGDPDAAIAALDHGFAVAAGTDNPRREERIATLLNSKGVILADAGRLAESVAVGRTAMVATERVYGVDHPALIADLDNLGLSLGDLGQHAEALVLARRALAIAEAHLPVDSVQRGYAVWNLALILGATDPRAAAPYFDQAQAIVEGALGPDHADSQELRADRARVLGPRRPRPPR